MALAYCAAYLNLSQIYVYFSHLISLLLFLFLYILLYSFLRSFFSHSCLLSSDFMLCTILGVRSLGHQKVLILLKLTLQ